MCSTARTSFVRNPSILLFLYLHLHRIIAQSLIKFSIPTVGRVTEIETWLDYSKNDLVLEKYKFMIFNYDFDWPFLYFFFVAFRI